MSRSSWCAGVKEGTFGSRKNATARIAKGTQNIRVFFAVTINTERKAPSQRSDSASLMPRDTKIPAVSQSKHLDKPGFDRK